VGALQAELDACRAQAMDLDAEVKRLSVGAPAVAAAVEAPTHAKAAEADVAAMEPDSDVFASRTAEADVAMPERDSGVFASRAPEVEIAVAPPAAEPAKPDDLTRLEGIGAKINGLLNEHGIFTFAQLAATPVEMLREILSSGGPRFSMADPGTWPQQAQLASDGEWDALEALQAKLEGGRLA